MRDDDFSWPGRRPGDQQHDLLAAFLVLDVQRSPVGAAELLAEIEKIKAGRTDFWQRIGNAYTLTLRPEQAEISSDYEAGAVVPLEDFTQAALAWQNFISQKKEPLS
uniref:hypothetical protein n=1 Tax=Candidatus Electronema sp. TaxID=2698783 RepID=UPI004057BC94